jgi:hypothetical protein
MAELTPDDRLLIAAASSPATTNPEHCRADYVIERHSFRYKSIEFVAQGHGELLLAGKRCALVPGLAFSYGPGIPHRIGTDPSAPMLKYFIDFTGTEADALLDTTAAGRGPVLVSEPDRIQSLFDEIQRQALGMGVHHAAICTLVLRLLPLTIESLAAALR